jgi:succinate dehydrogenase flavin-adding protein (antitoxin of CptAB toxin-antitoxin module)
VHKKRKKKKKKYRITYNCWRRGWYCLELMMAREEDAVNDKNKKRAVGDG